MKIYDLPRESLDNILVFEYSASLICCHKNIFNKYITLPFTDEQLSIVNINERSIADQLYVDHKFAYYSEYMYLLNKIAEFEIKEKCLKGNCCNVQVINASKKMVKNHSNNWLNDIKRIYNMPYIILNLIRTCCMCYGRPGKIDIKYQPLYKSYTLIPDEFFCYCENDKNIEEIRFDGVKITDVDWNFICWNLKNVKCICVDNSPMTFPHVIRTSRCVRLYWNHHDVTDKLTTYYVNQRRQNHINYGVDSDGLHKMTIAVKAFIPFAIFVALSKIYGK